MVVALHLVEVFHLLADVAQQAELLGDVGVVSRHRAPVPISAKIFAGVEAECGGIAQTAGHASLVAGTTGLRRVLEDQQVVLAGNGANGVHVGYLAIEMDGHDRSRAGGDSGLDLARVDVIGRRIAVDQHRDGSGIGYSQRGGDKCVGGGDNFVAGANIIGANDHLQRRIAGIDADAILDTAIFGECALEFGDGAAEDEIAALHDGEDSRINFVLNLSIL